MQAGAVAPLVFVPGMGHEFLHALEVARVRLADAAQVAVEDDGARD
jgi:hypothetical protein